MNSALDFMFSLYTKHQFLSHSQLTLPGKEAFPPPLENSNLTELSWSTLEPREDWVLSQRPKGGSQYKTSDGFKLRAGCVPIRRCVGDRDGDIEVSSPRLLLHRVRNELLPVYLSFF